MGYFILWTPVGATDDLRCSVFSSQRSGYMMFNDFAQNMGTDIRTLGRPFDDESANLDKAVQLWMVAPEPSGFVAEGVPDQEGNPGANQEIPSFGADDLKTLKSWVLRGGTLVLAPHYKNFLMVEPLINEAGFELGMTSVSTEGEEKVRYELLPETNEGLLGNVTSVDSYLYFTDKNKGIIFRFIPRDDRGEILLRDKYGIASARVKLGDGMLIIISDPYIFSNFLLPEADNSQFAANILARADASPVYYDEFHHGFVSQRTFGDMLRTRSGRGLVFLFAVAALGIYAAGRRFGMALPSPPPGRRSPAEYAISMGFLFKRAEATGLALDVMERDFANYLRHRFRVRTMDPSEVRAQLKTMGYEKSDEIIAILEEFERLRGVDRPSARSLLRLTQRIEPLKGVQS